MLAKLQESERTVMTLYYFGEMTCEEISKFLVVSANTIFYKMCSSFIETLSDFVAFKVLVQL
ncbi:hypothetical protein J5I95_15290 [Candidatus Poribacteria bacterium]|nr:hypothetical protein [Candidatus Poribacteria bacterium]